MPSFKRIKREEDGKSARTTDSVRHSLLVQTQDPKRESSKDLIISGGGSISDVAVVTSHGGLSLIVDCRIILPHDDKVQLYIYISFHHSQPCNSVAEAIH